MSLRHLAPADNGVGGGAALTARDALDLVGSAGAVTGIDPSTRDASVFATATGNAPEAILSALEDVGFVQCDLRERSSGLLRDYRAVKA
jgi:hypothetical protein